MRFLKVHVNKDKKIHAVHTNLSITHCKILGHVPHFPFVPSKNMFCQSFFTPYINQVLIKALTTWIHAPLFVNASFVLFVCLSARQMIDRTAKLKRSHLPPHFAIYHPKWTKIIKLLRKNNKRPTTTKTTQEKLHPKNNDILMYITNIYYCMFKTVLFYVITFHNVFHFIWCAAI